MNKGNERRIYLLSLLVSIVTALLLGAGIMALTGNNPLDGYGALVSGALGSRRKTERRNAISPCRHPASAGCLRRGDNQIPRPWARVGQQPPRCFCFQAFLHPPPYRQLFFSFTGHFWPRCCPILARDRMMAGRSGDRPPRNAGRGRP